VQAHIADPNERTRPPRPGIAGAVRYRACPRLARGHPCALVLRAPCRFRRGALPWPLTVVLRISSAGLACAKALRTGSRA
jgi:hypothetical protein